MKTEFIDLDSLSHLPYDLINCEKYIGVKRSHLPGSKRSFELHTDRGCPHRCGFCYNININKKKWRGFTAGNIVDQIEFLVNKFSLDGINFVADNFFVDRNRVENICKEIIKRNLKIIWHADCRIDYFIKYDDAFINLLKNSGCRVLTFGVESGSRKISDLINKDINIEDVFIVNEKIKKNDMGVNYHFMVGFPDEEKEDTIETYKTMMRLHKNNRQSKFFGPSIYTPYPGTPLYTRCITLGFKDPQRLEEWAKFDWDEKTRLPFLKSDYSQWLLRSAYILNRITSHENKHQWKTWWFRLRAKIIIKFKACGPVWEEKLMKLVRKIIYPIKKYLQKKLCLTKYNLYERG